MIKHLIARGIGFSPGSVKFIATHGFGIGEAQTIAPPHRTLVEIPEKRYKMMPPKARFHSMPPGSRMIGGSANRVPAALPTDVLATESGVILTTESGEGLERERL